MARASATDGARNMGPRVGPSRCEAPAVVTIEGPRDQPCIGVLTPLVAAGYYGSVIAGIATAARARGVRTIAIQTLDLSYGGAYAAAEAAVPSFSLPAAWERVAGFVVLLNAVEPWYLHALQEAGKPVVLLSHEVEGFTCPMVRADNRTGVIQAVTHLVGHGHRRIAFAGSLLQSDIRERLAAYREALAISGIEPDDDLTFEANDNLFQGGEAAARRMLAAGLPSTAVVAGTDWNALGMIKVFGEAGLSLPADLAITAFDDVEAGTSARPTLSTVRQPYDRTAALAAELLLRIIDGEEVAPGSHRVPSVFIPRESCGCDTGSRPRHTGDEVTATLQTPRERLRSRLAVSLAGSSTLAPAAATALDRAVDQISAFAEGGGEGVLERAGRFREAAQALWAVSPTSSTAAAAVGCLQDYRAELAEAGVTGPDAAEFALGLVDMVIHFTGSLATREAEWRHAVHERMGQDHDLSLSLMRGAAGDLASLDWIAHTPARAGCIGLWSDGRGTRAADGQLLTLAASYVKDGGRLALPDQLRVEEFPPAPLVEDLDWGPGEIGVVLPARTATSDLGMVSMVIAIDSVDDDVRDRLFEIAALISLSVEREEMTERLRRSNADLATFSHAMAHDLRNPLATISMWASVARARARPGGEAEPVLRIVDQIREVSGYANDLVSDLLRFVELDRGAGPRQPVDLNLATGRALATLESTIVEHGAVVEAGDLPVVRGGFAELELVLQNLIENAIKHHQGAARIRIDALRQDTVWVVRCRDDGAGISPAMWETIFEPFVRGKTATPGSGLGLATCRRVVEGLGGRIWVDASGAGGTTIALSIPIGSELDQAASAAPTRAAQAPSRRRSSRRGDAVSPPPAAA